MGDAPGDSLNMKTTKILLIILIINVILVIITSCSAKIIPSKYAVVKSVKQIEGGYLILSQPIFKPIDGYYLQSDQPIINFTINDTVYIKRIRTESRNEVRLFKL
jgi:ABC-type cobalt transport system substrate-binding protein